MKTSVERGRVTAKRRVDAYSLSRAGVVERRQSCGCQYVLLAHQLTGTNEGLTFKGGLAFLAPMKGMKILTVVLCRRQTLQRRRSRDIVSPPSSPQTLKVIVILSRVCLEVSLRVNVLYLTVVRFASGVGDVKAVVGLRMVAGAFRGLPWPSTTSITA